MAGIPQGVTLSFSAEVLEDAKQRLKLYHQEALKADPKLLRTDKPDNFTDLMDLVDSLVRYVSSGESSLVKHLNFLPTDSNPVRSLLASSELFGVVFVETEPNVFVAEDIASMEGLSSS
ncbi:hypothetical protein [Roseobacter sp. MH60115]|uniref:hypothetical protein n=1 Tax=Roseobacter sp. MH60115 TaxID=2785324 RepID=UPI0018A31478|nr:hypothetical protein [Roseobacter sp. MH60115]